MYLTGGVGWIAPALALIVLMIAAAGLFIRRTWLRAAGIEQQLEEFRIQLRDQLRLRDEAEQRRAQDSQAEIQKVRHEISGQIASQSAAQAYDSSQILRGVNGIPSATAALHDQVADVSSQISSVADTVEIIFRQAPRSCAIDSSILETKTEDELIAVAESVAFLRPLVPYPKWRFDADLANPDLAFQVRRWLWQYFNDRKREGPIVIPWHYGTRLRLFLGNDMSRQIYVAGCVEPNEFAFFDRVLQPGMTFLDAGANDGIYTVFAAKRVGNGGTVWAFEPSGRELSRLRHNLELNHLTAHVFPLALADCSGQAELSVGAYEHAGHNTLGAFAYQTEMERIALVEVRRLDEVLNENPLARLDLMKIDVEGAELRLLRGAIETLRKYRPVLLFEVSEGSLKHQGGSPRELLAFLHTENYLIYTFDRVTGLPVPAAPGVFAENMIGYPVEKPMPASSRWSWPTQSLSC
jgi:FkbM family methyltransferase